MYLNFYFLFLQDAQLCSINFCQRSEMSNFATRCNLIGQAF
uniref:Uncharacterized protein n=1 Tax=Anguilla anguilla TaxID=7936 RepID=A0A0E9WAD9_ANGAN